jgi:putative nucleotidyltransferase with HDIG domain
VNSAPPGAGGVQARACGFKFPWAGAEEGENPPNVAAQHEGKTHMTPSASVDVRQLRVGMYVHLDLGWMSHPFPLSSFKITSDDQIATIRSLGLKTVRWCPDKSDPEPGAEAAAGSAAAGAAGGAPSPDDAAADAGEDEATRLRRQALEAQREASARVQQQYHEASREWQQLTAMVPTEPGNARDRAEGLTRALLDKMLGGRELCIRLLTEASGDRACAHAINVSILSLLMGRVFGMSDVEMLDLGMGAMLHDVGKLDLPERLREPDYEAPPAAQAQYRSHVVHGVQHAQRMKLSAGALLVIAQHHEQADGTGFPQKLNVDRMTMAARIVSLINRYDNLCNPLQSAKSLTPHEALSVLFAQGKTKFDVTMLNTFIRMMGVYPPGSLVQLTDDRYAMVVAVNSGRPLKPRVLLHDEAVPPDQALLLDLEREPELGIRRSLRAPQLPPAALQYLAPRPHVAYFFEPVADPVDEREEAIA